MNILLLGSGGREHAFAHIITKSNHCTQLFIAPGNAGTQLLGTNVNIDINDFDALHQFCLQQSIKLIVVGPEEPLVNGIVDYFTRKNIPIVGPDKYAAQLEGSKAFAKTFMAENNIPTAAYKEFNASSYNDGIDYLKKHSLPIVLKADGLAAGKGVVICQTHQEALNVFEQMIQHKQFGEASSKVVVEQFLDGIELSVFALTDGENYIILPEAKDYKRIGEGDTGLNTGGMGAISPVPFYEGAFKQKVIDAIIKPTIQGFKKRNMHYKGFVFFGLINVQNEPYVIEYNCRMGDPETEVVLPRLKNDFVALLLSLFNNTLATQKVAIKNNSACTIVAVSEGYPGDYTKGITITLPNVVNNDSYIYHAGTKNANNEIQTNGGRVLCVTSLDNSMNSALQKSKAAMQQIHFKGMYYRNDIGYEFI
jgi:phosphoribosylamine---glycine ligase